MKTLVLSLFVGVCLAFTAALPFFDNTGRDFRGFAEGDNREDDAPAQFGVAPQDQFGMVPQDQFGFAPQNQVQISSSASDWDSTPSDGGGDTNPVGPTPGPGGSPTQGVGAGGPVLISEGSSGGMMTGGIIVGLAVVVGIAVGVAIFIIKKKG